MKANYASWHIKSIDIYQPSQAERLAHLIRYAVLAPSAHNTQPWRFTVEPSQNKIIIALERSRLLQQSDPIHRQAYLSLGAAIENIVTATTAYGGTCSVRYTPQKEAVANLTIKWPTNNVEPDIQKLQAIKHRHTNRGNYAKTVPPKDLSKSLEVIQAPGISIHATTSEVKKKKVAQVAKMAALSLMNNAFKRELADWVHHNWTDEYTGMPAGVQGIPGLISLAAKFIISKAPIEKDQAKKDAAQLSKAPLLVAICAADDDACHWLEAGRVFERVCLQATARQLATSAYASVVECEPARDKLQKIIGTSEYPLALLRIGTPLKHMPISPRLPANRVTTV